MGLKRKLDFTNTEDGFTLIPKGVYPAFVFSIEEKVSTTGNDMLKVVLKIADGEFKGRQIFTSLVFVEAAMFKIKEFLTACGVNVPKKAVDIDFSKCMGKKIKIEINHRASKDKPDELFADVKKYISPTAAPTSSTTPPATHDDDDDEALPFK